MTEQELITLVRDLEELLADEVANRGLDPEGMRIVRSDIEGTEIRVQIRGAPIDE